MAINGRQYDWEDLTVVMPHGPVFGIQEINYEDGQEIEARYGKGAVPRGWGRKNYEASGSYVLDKDEWERHKIALAANSSGGIYDHRPFTIVVNYANPDQGIVTDTLPDVKITKAAAASKQGEANDGQVSVEFICLSPILWNGIPAKRG